ncbi:MAG: FG-GAP-like repeat-containing protein [Nannocystales bacterium]
MIVVNRSPWLKHSAPLFAGATLLALTPSAAQAMDPFEDSTPLVNNMTATSGAPMGVADMNGDGLDDIVRLDDTRYLEIEYQQPDGTFEVSATIDTFVQSWSIAIADVDGNGFNDIFLGGAFDDKLLYLANDDGSAYSESSLPGPGIFVQCSSFADINNDGDLDFFVCSDTSKSLVYHGDGTGTLTATYEALDPESTVPSDDSGNYGNVWTDYDLDGDIDFYLSKCRQGVNNPEDGRRLNQLFRNNGDGTFTDVAPDVGLRPRGQTWASDFADIDNDGDLDAIVLNHDYVAADAPSELYENDGTGIFSPITDAAGVRGALDSVGLGIQTYFGDFDNDGYVDLLISTGDGDHQVLFNDGDGTFSVDNSVLPSDDDVQSFAIGDLNHDGALDIVAGYGAGFNQPTNNPDRLLLNPANNGNNWLEVRLTGTTSNRAGIGAVVRITGSWGTQTREFRAGESYGISHSHTEHFGLGPDETIDTATITWPSGTVDVIEDVGANQVVHVFEGCETEFFVDADGDGFGDPSTGEVSCFKAEGRVEDATDCADDEPNNFPGNAEVCDEEDNNCNDEADDGIDCGAGSSGGDESGTSGGGGSSSDSGVDPTGDSDGTTTGPVDPMGTSSTSDGNPTTGTPTTAGPTDPSGAADSTGSGTDGETDGSPGQADGGGCSVGTSGDGDVSPFLLLGLVAPLARRRKRRS